jgi:hypothetical protein
MTGDVISVPGTSTVEHLSSPGLKTTYIANIVWFLLEFCQLLWADDGHLGILYKTKRQKQRYETWMNEA